MIYYFLATRLSDTVLRAGSSAASSVAPHAKAFEFDYNKHSKIFTHATLHESTDFRESVRCWRDYLLKLDAANLSMVRNTQ